MADWLHEARPSIPSPKTTKPIRFRDINCDYSIDKHDLLVEEDLAVRNQIRNVLSTLLGSEDFEPTFGSNLPLRLYDPIVPITGFILETDTIVALATWMGNRITVAANVSITPLEEDDGYLIVIPYTINTTGTTVVYSFEALR